MDPEKFAKVLALIESDHHGESRSALRAARIMLSRAGMTFRDLAALTRGAKVPAAPVPSAPDVVAVNAEIETLRQQINDLETRLQTQDETILRQRTELARQRQEIKRWHKLARETAEKLWDVGQALERQHRRLPTTDKRRALLEYLRDPGTAEWSDREIARRVGVGLHAVNYWRRRLVIATHSRRLIKVQLKGRRLLQRLGDELKLF